ncbi:MAG: site-2 protease family protein [Mogibacterium sp.]|nr:site-2 protease family protein [Mogibacterium sp.]
MNLFNFSYQAILLKILMLPGIVVGLSFHEFAHAWVSDRLGDPTPRRQGRLTLNPLAHIDWLGFAALLLVGFGWGKPVQINPAYYKNRRRDEFLVGIAGITMNLILAVLFSIPVRLLRNIYLSSSIFAVVIENLFLILMYAVMINLVLMVFNLIPCPPLDGWGIITQIFKLDRHEWWYSVYQRGTWILLLLIVFNITDMILTPIVSFMMNILVYR